MNISPHIARAAIFGEHAVSPAQYETAVWLAGLLIEPVIERFGRLTITSGYRPPAENALAGGVGGSAHLFPAGERRGAVDFQPAAQPGMTQPRLREIFDWIRARPLPFHRLGLEVNREEPWNERRGCIHIEIAPAPERIVFVGYTRGGPYVHVSRGRLGRDDWPALPLAPLPAGPWAD